MNSSQHIFVEWFQIYTHPYCAKLFWTTTIPTWQLVGSSTFEMTSIFSIWFSSTSSLLLSRIDIFLGACNEWRLATCFRETQYLCPVVPNLMDIDLNLVYIHGSYSVTGSILCSKWIALIASNSNKQFGRCFDHIILSVLDLPSRCLEIDPTHIATDGQDRRQHCLKAEV